MKSNLRMRDATATQARGSVRPSRRANGMRPATRPSPARPKGAPRLPRSVGKRSPILIGDVVAQLESLPSSTTFDVVIADPPYNIGKDFGNNQDTMPLADYIDWSTRWINLCLRRLRAGGILYVYGFPEVLARVASCFPIENQRWLQWHYTNKTVPGSTFWQRSHESILAMWPDGERRPSLEIDQIREPYNPNYLNCKDRARRPTPGRFGHSGKPTVYRVHDGGALPRDVIKIPALAGGAGRNERWFICRSCGNKLCSPAEVEKHRDCDLLKHPTQKPTLLTKKLIQSRINGSGGTLLVPFAGSGSECVVAQRLGVEFLGFEINPEYVKLALGWLKADKKMGISK